MPNLPFDLPPPKKRKRRRRARSAVRERRREPSQLALFRAPDVQKCGFCGAMVTVFEDAAACPNCGGIVSRDD